MPCTRSQPRRSNVNSARAGSVSGTMLHVSPPRARDDRVDLCEAVATDEEKIARARTAMPAEATLSRLADTLRALGDLTRLRIVCALATERVDELCVCDLATLVGVSDSAVSHSLRTLRQLGLVRYRKAGKIAYYTLDHTHLAELVREGVRHTEHDA